MQESDDSSSTSARPRATLPRRREPLPANDPPVAEPQPLDFSSFTHAQIMTIRTLAHAELMISGRSLWAERALWAAARATGGSP